MGYSERVVKGRCGFRRSQKKDDRLEVIDITVRIYCSYLDKYIDLKDIEIKSYTMWPTYNNMAEIEAICPCGLKHTIRVDNESSE